MTASVPARTNTVTVGTVWGILVGSRRLSQHQRVSLTTAPAPTESPRQRFLSAGAVSMFGLGHAR